MDDQMLKTMKQQNFWLRLSALFMLGIFLVAMFTAITLVPQATKVLVNAEKTLEEADVAVQELNKTATQLAKIDFEGLVSDTQQLVNDSSLGIAQAIGTLDDIDIEGLNEAISDLEAVVSPLARLFGKK